jgi:isoleucyl-tRNA synthetase
VCAGDRLFLEEKDHKTGRINTGKHYRDLPPSIFTMSLKYKEYQQLNLPAIGQEILARWDEAKAFEKSVEIREGAVPFVFYEGPPSANGMPGIHHVISRTLKDMVCRYKTMQGFQVKRKGGWDTHGLPVELGVEKLLGITKEDIGKKISVEEYNETCRREVLKFKDQWDDITRKMGYWVDLQQPYITFENNYIESLWWSLSELYKKELLYESVSIQPYSPAAGTGLSSHELNMPGAYKDVKDTSCVAIFQLLAARPGENGYADELLRIARNAWTEADGDLASKTSAAEVGLMAWTTTPWTLPSNCGLTVGPNIDYVLVKTINPYTHLPNNVILAKALLGKHFKPEGESADFAAYKEGDKILPWQIIAECKGRDMEGMRYAQLLPSEANTAELTGGDPFRVIPGDFVTTEDGTGIVHTAPAFGADDFKVGKKFNLGILTLVDRQGKFIDGVGEFSGRYVKNYKDDNAYVDVNVDICVKLKKENRAFKVEKYEHNYPHCWRTDKPIIYYPLDAWFIKTTALKDRMVNLNKTINWKPKATGEGRFGNWLENMVDWNLSRSRYWGTPLPIWKTEDGSEEKCIGSIAELMAEAEKATTILGSGVNEHLSTATLDLHKPYVDQVTLVSESGQPMRRIADLIDVWYDSGAMPFAQFHFPFENKELFAKSYPADFIAEGVDQTRGWFYTLHALGSLLKESIAEELAKAGIAANEADYTGLAYKTVISNGLVLDKNGVKMSKRLGNIVNPFQTIEQLGPDATRWYLITNANPWDSMKFDIDGIKEIQRKFFGTLYNTYQFFALYANVDGFHFKEASIPVTERPEIDQWILSSLHTLIDQVNAKFNEYEPTLAGRLIEEFVDEHLSNWYVRLCRRRFWKGEYEQDKISAYQTLYECLETLSRLMAPVAPFFADWLFLNLNDITGRFTEASVHHVLYPTANTGYIDKALEERMQLAQDASSLILSLRKKVNIRVRQPLQKVLIPVLDPQMKEQVARVEALIKTEVNVKEIQYLTDTEGFIKKKVKPNFKALGNRMGARMKAVTAAIADWGEHDIARIEKEGQIILSIDNEPVTILFADVDIQSEDIPGWLVANKGSLTVALDITISETLKQEGDAREFVNRVQNIRKDSNFELTDRISVKVLENTGLKNSITQFNDYICAEILADQVVFVPEIQGGIEIDINDIPLTLTVIKTA